MKFLLFATAISLFSGVMLPVWAGSPSSASSESISSNAPSIAPVSVDARDLTAETTPERSSVQSPNHSERLSEQAQRINRNLGTQQSPPPQQLQELREMLDLPDGMVIRGGSRGGVGVGREF